MRIPYRWLREFVDTTAEARDVAERLTMAGIETGLVAAGASELAGLVVAEVLDVVAHPAGGTLRVCEVSTGAERYRVVCGAPNVRAGVRAAFAPPGAALPGGRRVAVATIRGTASEGMLCSEAELGIGEDQSGILLLGADAPVGADLVSHLGLDDAILEVEVTPNRPDCLADLRRGPRGGRAPGRPAPAPGLHRPRGPGADDRRLADHHRGPGSLSALRGAARHRRHGRPVARPGSPSGSGRPASARSTTSST